jgi:hypothetical protein
VTNHDAAWPSTYAVHSLRAPTRAPLDQTTMSPLLSVVALSTVAVVVAALFLVLWRERTSTRDALIAATCGILLAAWAVAVIVLARAGWFEAGPEDTVPPVGRAIGLALLVLWTALAISPSLRRLLSWQSNLIRLHLWRFFGIVFLTLMAFGQLPALFALPAGIGDILIAAAAPWVARGLDAPGGRRRAIVFSVLGMIDLIVAAGLGITTNPGRAHLFDTFPSSEVMTRFPMALVPAFLVPLAFTLHMVLVWQLLGGNWARPAAEPGRAPRASRS